MISDRTKVQFLPANDPYAKAVEQFISIEFPEFGGSSAETTLEAVMSEFLATKSVRLGPKPNVESQYMMRQVVREAMRRDSAIPVLIPSGAAKRPLVGQVDLAEMSAIHIIGCLNDRVMKHYPPGLMVNVRMEDATKHVLADKDYGEDEVSVRVAEYIEGFTKLIRALDYDFFIQPVRESDASGGLRPFLAQVAMLTPIFYEYLMLERDPTSKAFKELKTLGWGGEISPAMVGYFNDRYSRLYPEERKAERTLRMAGYFASILTRRRLGGVGRHEGWDQTLEISFSPPMPDAPLVSPRVHYRTAMRNGLAPHIPYWAAKGVLNVLEDEMKINLFHWYDLPEMVPGKLLLSNTRGDEVEVDAPYILAENEV